MQKIINDLEKKLNINIKNENITPFNDGHTKSKVYGINQKYVIKTFTKKSLKNQLLFYKEYNSNIRYPKIITYNLKLNYICFSYIQGKKLDNNIDLRNIINQIYEVINSYKEYKNYFWGYLDNKKISWYNFLKYEIYHAYKNSNYKINIEKALTSLKIIKKYKVKKYLLHGDLGLHNFIINNLYLYIIDSMPIVGDRLYDFYFAILSLYNSNELDLSYILSFYDDSLEYKKALLTIILVIIMGRCYIYHPNKLNAYLNLYNRL